MRRAVPASVALLAIGISIAAAIALANTLAPDGCNANREAGNVDAIIAMGWGAGKYGPAFYGAQVYVEPSPSGYAVRARVHIGPGNGYFHDLGTLGSARTFADAVAKWGKVDFQADGLRIGNGLRPLFVPQADLERHR